MSFKKPFLALSLLSLLSACGDQKTPNSAPEISGWSMATEYTWGEPVNESMLVKLTPSVFDAERDALTYQWRLLTETDKITLINTSAPILSFNYPVSVSEEVYELAFEVTVTDERGASTRGNYEDDFNDYVYIDLPVDFAVQEGQEVTVTPRLFGRTSYISHYQWQVTSEHDITLIGEDTQHVSFVVPNSPTPITLSLTTTYIDGHDEVREMDIIITQ